MHSLRAQLWFTLSSFVVHKDHNLIILAFSCVFSSDHITTEYSTAASSKTSDKTAEDFYSETFESGGGDSYDSDFTESDASSVRKKVVNSASVQTDPVHVVQSDAMDPGGWCGRL